MTSHLSVLDPVAPTAVQSERLDLRLESLKGKVVGFIDNAKPNFNHLVDDLGELLVQRHGVDRVIKHRKPGQVPVAEAVLAQMAQDCDLVITGSGD